MAHHHILDSLYLHHRLWSIRVITGTRTRLRNRNRNRNNILPPHVHIPRLRHHHHGIHLRTPPLTHTRTNLVTSLRHRKHHKHHCIHLRLILMGTHRHPPHFTIRLIHIILRPHLNPPTHHHPGHITLHPHLTGINIMLDLHDLFYTINTLIHMQVHQIRVSLFTGPPTLLFNLIHILPHPESCSRGLTTNPRQRLVSRRRTTDLAASMAMAT